MSRSDLIADVFSVIRNAMMAKKESVDVPVSGTVKSILEILKKQKYIENFKLIDDKKQGRAKIYLRYIADKPAIRNIKRVSRSGLRVYVKHNRIPSVLRGRGIAIISTSKGVITDREAAESGVGGEIIGYIW